MTEDARHHVDISNLPRRIREAIEHYESVVDVLRDRVRQIALAAMVRDPAVGAIDVSVEGGSSRSWIVSRVLLEGVAAPDLHDLVERRVMQSLRELGWQEVQPPENKTCKWRLIDVRRHEASAHEMATAARAMGL